MARTVKSVRAFLVFGGRRQVAADYTVKAGDTKVDVLIDLSFSTGTQPDLTPFGTTAHFLLRPVRAATVLDVVATIVDAVTVKATLDIPTVPGVYEGEVFVQWLDGRSRRFPADPDGPYVVFDVQPAIAAVSP